MRSKSLFRCAAVVSAGALLLSACGGSDDSASGADEITIGVIAPLAGAAALPEIKTGLDAVQHQINKVDGGINDVKIKFDLCESDGTPEYLINCANGFINDGVPVVYDANDVQVASAATNLKTAGIPLFGSYPAGTVTDTQEAGTSFYIGAGAGMHARATVELLKKTGGDSFSLVVPAGAASKDYVEKALRPAIEAFPAKLEVQYVDTGAVNPEVLAATALNAGPDVVGVISLPDDDCTNFFESVRSQGFDGPLVAGPCTGFVDAMGADAEGALRISRMWTVSAKQHAPENVKEQLTTYEAALKSVDGTDDLNNAWATATFGGLMTLADVLRGIDGDITSKSVTTALKGLNGAETWFFPTATCDGKQWPSAPGACSHSELFMTVQADGSLKPQDEGFTEIPIPAS